MMLTCRNLTLAWHQTTPGAGPLLDAVNGSFDYGRATLVTGPTGSGKSTLLHLMGGLLQPTSGEVVDGDDSISRWTTDHRDRWRRKVGICFQGLHLMPELSVRDTLLQPMIPRNMGWQAMVDLANGVASRLDLAGLEEVPVQHLSGGQQQRVAIARAMVHAPQILLLDEPTAFQDDDHTHRLMDLFDRSADGGVCVVISSHDPRLRQGRRYPNRYQLSGGRLEVSA
jgi:ABC-type lipoprotein export system ATPase subunit